MHFYLSDLMIDIVQNSAEAGADLMEISIDDGFDCTGGRRFFCFSVKDNGIGMNEEEIKEAGNPFFTKGDKHPHRRVGLGLPFLIQTVNASGGEWEIKSPLAFAALGETSALCETVCEFEKGFEKRIEKGLEIWASFNMNEPDTPPIGDIPGMIRTAFLFEGPREIIVRRKGKFNYEVRKSDLDYISMDNYLRSLEIEDGEIQKKDSKKRSMEWQK